MGESNNYHIFKVMKSQIRITNNFYKKIVISRIPTFKNKINGHVRTRDTNLLHLYLTKQVSQINPKDQCSVRCHSQKRSPSYSHL